MLLSCASDYAPVLFLAIGCYGLWLSRLLWWMEFCIMGTFISFLILFWSNCCSIICENQTKFLFNINCKRLQRKMVNCGIVHSWKRLIGILECMSMELLYYTMHLLASVTEDEFNLYWIVIYSVSICIDNITEIHK